jgi:hypothetical protein
MGKLSKKVASSTRKPALTSHDRVRIAGVAIVALRTVERIYSGARATDNARERVRQAAETLGLPPPPEAEPGPSQRGAVPGVEVV